MTYCIIKHSAISITLFLLMYDKEAILLIDETKSLMIYECMISIMEEISHIRKEARLMI